MFVHGVNVFISDFVSQATEANACVFYFLNILIDTTIGQPFVVLLQMRCRLTLLQASA